MARPLLKDKTKEINPGRKAVSAQNHIAGADYKPVCSILKESGGLMYGQTIL